MRFSLFKLTIQHAGGEKSLFIVAPDPDRAKAFADELDMPSGDVTLRLDRIDETLPEDRQLGLEDFLENAPTGLASFCEGVGWISYETPTSKLKLYHFEMIDRSSPFVVAPSIEAAVAAFADWASLGADPHRVFKVTEPLKWMKGGDRQELEGLLEAGPIGVVTWTEEDGWARR